MAFVVVAATSLTFVVYRSLLGGVTLWEQAKLLPGYLSDTFLHFDFGEYGPPTQRVKIRDEVFSGLPVDAQLLAGGMVVGVAVGVTTGTLCGPRRGGTLDRALLFGTTLGMSAPVFWLGYVVLLLFAPVTGRWQVPFVSDAGMYASPTRDPVGWLHAMWAPWLILAVPIAAAAHRMVRATLHDVLDEDVLRTARAKGLRDRIVMRRHALPLALPPVLGLMSASMALLATNVALIERPFKLPGSFRYVDVGQYLGETGGHSPSADFVQAVVVAITLLVVSGILVCDVLQARLDPRVAARG
jgi:peptide/nickel transport system permease protein